MRNTLPSFSVVIEWENARLSELDRAREMLRRLAAQIQEIGPELDQPPELSILYDPEAIDPAVIRAAVDDAFRRAPIAMRLLPSQRSGYYRQKNEGAALSSRELVMFLDSDVIPEEGWLRALVGSFRDPGAQVVCGNTYIDPQGIYSKAFAAFWFFPLRSAAGGLVPASHFFANNVVFRRDLFLRYGFPDLPMLRGQCTALAEALTQDGHAIHVQNAARVSHPPPNGLGHFVRRALCEGHDRVERSRVTGGRRFPLGALARFKQSLRHSGRQIWRSRRALGLNPAAAAAALGIATAYYALCLVGEGVAQASPKLIPEKLAV